MGKVFCRKCGKSFEPSKNHRILCLACKVSSVMKPQKRERKYAYVGSQKWEKIKKAYMRLGKWLDEVKIEE